MTIRAARPDDAEQIIAHVQRLAEEPGNNLPMAPGEFQVTVEEERQLLTDYAAADNCIYLVAEVDGRIVGILNCKGGKRQATRHSASFGISIARDGRNQGVGTALMSFLLDWAKTTGIISRLELEVYAHNATAIHLYRKFGFIEEGRRKQAYFQQGQFIDSIIMAVLL